MQPQEGRLIAASFLLALFTPFAFARLSPNVAISRRFMDETFNEAYETFLRVNQAFGVLTLMAFGIGVAGLSGMVAFVAARRRPEIDVLKTFARARADGVDARQEFLEADGHRRDRQLANRLRRRPRVPARVHRPDPSDSGAVRRRLR